MDSQPHLKSMELEADVGDSIFYLLYPSQLLVTMITACISAKWAVVFDPDCMYINN